MREHCTPTDPGVLKVRRQIGLLLHTVHRYPEAAAQLGCLYNDLLEVRGADAEETIAVCHLLIRIRQRPGRPRGTTHPASTGCRPGLERGEGPLGLPDGSGGRSRPGLTASATAPVAPATCSPPSWAYRTGHSTTLPCNYMVTAYVPPSCSTAVQLTLHRENLSLACPASGRTISAAGDQLHGRADGGDVLLDCA
jgi:hypothetical protein